MNKKNIQKTQRNESQDLELENENERKGFLSKQR